MDTGGALLYPFATSNPLTSVAFNESSVLAAAKLDVANGTFEVWYTDEHALSLGVRQVIVKTPSGTSTTNYAIATMTANPDVAINPAVGTTATTGDQAEADAPAPIKPRKLRRDFSDPIVGPHFKKVARRLTTSPRGQAAANDPAR